ncbi:MAG: hypothetical protein RLY86_3816 [Pseudomonadota bacterium]|jgi:hypothetical protein
MGIILQRAASGNRTPRGLIVRRIQESLADQGHPVRTIDGIFGGETEGVLKSWQEGNGIIPHGQLDGETWQGLMQAPIPDLFDRCLQLTADFEGHGFTLAKGNWDRAHLTWGIVGFTLKHGNLGKVIQQVEQKAPHLLVSAFGAERARELLRVVDAPAAEQRAWADGISVAPSKVRLQPPWAAGFAALGSFLEVQEIQVALAKEIYWARAERDFRRLGLTEARDMALCFDAAVQNGGIDDDKESRFRTGLAGSGGGIGAEDRRLILATAVAEGSKPRFKADVMARKGTIALGHGIVHEGRYRLDDWGLAAASDAAALAAATRAAPSDPGLVVAPVTAPVAATVQAPWQQRFEAYIGSLGLRYFKPYEFLVKGNQHANAQSPAFGLNQDPPEELWPNIGPTAQVLDELRHRLKAPIVFASVYRSPAYNRAIGGAAASLHMQFMAVDFVVRATTTGPQDWAALLRELRQQGMFRGGIAAYPTFVHVDTRGHDSNWGD